MLTRSRRLFIASLYVFVISLESIPHKKLMPAKHCAVLAPTVVMALYCVKLGFHIAIVR